MSYSESVAKHLNQKQKSWTSGAEGTMGSTGSYDPNSETANLYKAAEEDGGSRVDDGAGWREIHRDNTPGSAEEYAAMVRKYAADGFDIKAIDMDKGFSHANFAVKPKDAKTGKSTAAHSLKQQPRLKLTLLPMKMSSCQYRRLHDQERSVSQGRR